MQWRVLTDLWTRVCRLCLGREPLPVPEHEYCTAVALADMKQSSLHLEHRQNARWSDHTKEKVSQAARLIVYII